MNNSRIPYTFEENKCLLRIIIRSGIAVLNAPCKAPEKVRSECNSFARARLHSIAIRGIAAQDGKMHVTRMYVSEAMHFHKCQQQQQQQLRQNI